jgi:hypothetical protein
MENTSPTFSLQSFNTFDMGVNWSPVPTNTITLTPNYVSVNINNVRPSYSPMGASELAFATEKADSEEDGNDVFKEIIDLTDADDKDFEETIIGDGTENNPYTFTKIGTNDFGYYKRNAWTSVNGRELTPYRPRKPVVSILAPLKKRRGSKHEQSVIHQRDAV